MAQNLHSIPQISKNGNYPKWIFWKKRRNVVAILGFFGFFNVYALRANLSVAIVAMTANRTTVLDNITITQDPEFKWNSKMRGHVLSAFFYGYITTQVFGGWLSVKIGGQKLFGIGIVMTGILTLLTPWFSRISVYLLIALRIAEGVFEGITFPSMSTVWSKWAPPLERTKLATIAASGCGAGIVVSMPVSAYLAETIGWPSVFYVFGGISIIWFVIWTWFVKETPAEDPKICKSELDYIQHCLGSTEAKQKIKHPWKNIFTSSPVWSIVIYNFADNWASYTLMTQIPTYLKDMFEYDLGKIGCLSALPYIAMTVAVVLSGQISDWLLKRQICTRSQVRKIFTCGSSVGQTICLIAASHSFSVTPTVVLMILGVAFGTSAYSGYAINSLDIAPQHAGLITGIANTAGTLAGICSSIFAGYIVTTSSPEQWRIVFYVTSSILLFGGVVYGVFASGEIQAWNVKSKSTESSSYLLKSRRPQSYNDD